MENTENPNPSSEPNKNPEGQPPSSASPGGAGKPESPEKNNPEKTAATPPKEPGHFGHEATTAQPEKATSDPNETLKSFQPSPQHAALSRINNAVNNIRNEIGKVIIGQHEMIDLMLAGIFCGGHVLLEGVPGIAKTMSAKLLSQSLSIDFSRIQFTPDLMPTDILGTSVYNMKEGEFNFKKGPIFSNIILIDEINRSPAKTQAALFEVMEERQITIDGHTYSLSFPFFVIATQNPIEQEGTYKLPEAQLDRFLFRIKLKYPSLDEEKAILKKFRDDFNQTISEQVKGILNADEIKECQKIVEKIHIKDQLTDYIAEIIHNTRNNGDLFLGASPRASLSILKASKAIAAMNGREFVTPDDIQYVATPVLNHRVIPSSERELEGIEVEEIIREIIKKIEVPR